MPRAAGVTETAERSGLVFSESGIVSLVRPGGWRRLRRFAGSAGASNVAFRGITPARATAIQAVTGSGVDAGQIGGTRSTKQGDLRDRVTSSAEQGQRVGGRGIQLVERGYQTGTCGTAPGPTAGRCCSRIARNLRAIRDPPVPVISPRRCIAPRRSPVRVRLAPSQTPPAFAKFNALLRPFDGGNLAS